MLPIAALLPLLDKVLIAAKPLLYVPGVTSLLGKVQKTGDVVQDGVGKSQAVTAGVKSISKTKAGATLLAAVGPDWPTLIEGVFNLDPASIGKLVLILVGYVLALAGRGNKA